MHTTGYIYVWHSQSENRMKMCKHSAIHALKQDMHCSIFYEKLTLIWERIIYVHYRSISHPWEEVHIFKDKEFVGMDA